MRKSSSDSGLMDEPRTRQEALALATDWAMGRRSHTNTVYAPTPERKQEVVAVMDAQEVVKWTALAAVLPVGQEN